MNNYRAAAREYRAAARELTVSAKTGGARLRNGDIELKLLLQEWHNTDKRHTITCFPKTIREKNVCLNMGRDSTFQNLHLQKLRQQESSHYNL